MSHDELDEPRPHKSDELANDAAANANEENDSNNNDGDLQIINSKEEEEENIKSSSDDVYDEFIKHLRINDPYEMLPIMLAERDRLRKSKSHQHHINAMKEHLAIRAARALALSIHHYLQKNKLN